MPLQFNQFFFQLWDQLDIGVFIYSEMREKLAFSFPLDEQCSTAVGTMEDEGFSESDIDQSSGEAEEDVSSGLTDTSFNDYTD